MDRNFTETETNQIIRYCLEAYDNLLKYCCRENIECWPSIKRHIKTVKKHNIIPELYWHGNADEFSWLLCLLSDGYPGTLILLDKARKKTKGEIKKIADHFYQHANVMFDYVKTYAGYVVLKPTEYMLKLYPDSKEKLYIYTSNVWNHHETSGINGVFLIIDSEQLDNVPVLVKSKIGYV